MTNTQTTQALTDKFIKALIPSKTAYRKVDGLNDPSIKGFNIQVAPSGTKTFSLSYTSPEVCDIDVNGSEKLDKHGAPLHKRRFFKIGIYPDITLKDARDQCRSFRAQIMNGIDPFEEQIRQNKKMVIEDEIRNNRGTVEQLFDFYIQDLKLDGKASTDEILRIYEKDIHPVIGEMKTKDVTKKDCALVIKKVVDRGADTMANRTRSYMHAAFKFGIYAEDEPRWMGKVPDFYLLHNPVAQTRRHLKTERVGDRALSRGEVKQLWVALDNNSMKPSFILALKLLISTGQRVRQLLEAEWTEFDFDENVWEIPESRNRKGASQAKRHTVALTAFHIELLTEVKKLSLSGYLFPNEAADGPLDDALLGKALKRFCKPDKYSNGFEKFSLRDIRRTWKTLAASIGIDLELRNRIQGHALSDVGSKHYDRYSYLNEKRAGMKRYTTWLETVIRGDSNNVVPMSKTGSR